MSPEWILLRPLVRKGRKWIQTTSCWQRKHRERIRKRWSKWWCPKARRRRTVIKLPSYKSKRTHIRMSWLAKLLGTISFFPSCHKRRFSMWCAKWDFAKPVQGPIYSSRVTLVFLTTSSSRASAVSLSIMRWKGPWSQARPLETSASFTTHHALPRS